jgi:hypothetical protein
MFERFFDAPLLVSGILIVGSLCLYAVAGIWLVRRHVLPRLSIRAGDSEFSSAMLQAVMVFYGLAVALIAVSVWQTYSDVSKVVSQEATKLAVLYRDVSAYPEPLRSQLQEKLRRYVAYVIEEAWPEQQRGRTPVDGVAKVDEFEDALMGFEPATEGRKLLHAETLQAFDEMVEARRLRLDAVGTGLPGILWLIVIIGALISLSSSFLFVIEDARVQGLQAVLLAIFMGLVIVMIVALDRPFRGELGLRSDPYRLVYEQLMKR